MSMLPTLAALALSLSPLQSASDFFPLEAGTKWVYQESRGRASAIVTDVAKAPVMVGGGLATPVETRIEGALAETIYYRLTGDTAFIVAYDLKKPLETPRPAFRIASGKTTWEYQGVASIADEQMPLRVTGTSEPKGKRKILGVERECVEVKLEASVGPEGQTPVITRQTVLYARGLGLVEMNAKSTMGRKTEETKLKLVEFVPPKP